MLSYKVTLLAVLIVLSLFVQNVDAHLPLGQDSVDPSATVTKETTGDACVVRMTCSAKCTFRTGTHNPNQFHPHSAAALLQVYYHQPGGTPGFGIGLYKVTSESKTLWGQKTWTTPTLTIEKTIPFGCWVGGAVSSGSLGYTVNGKTYHIVDANSTSKKVCSPCSPPGAAPGIFGSTIQEKLQEQDIDLDDIRDKLRHAIKTARATNPDVDFAIYFKRRIQTLAFNPDNMYISQSDDSTTLKLGYPDDTNLTVVELDPLDGFEYQPPAAPPKLKPSKGALTTTWAAVKQK